MLAESQPVILAKPSVDLRDECWSVENEDGNRRIYWQWRERNTKRKAYYGGTAETIPGGQQRIEQWAIRSAAKRAAKAQRAPTA
jgi:hypothetical protein